MAYNRYPPSECMPLFTCFSDLASDKLSSLGLDHGSESRFGIQGVTEAVVLRLKVIVSLHFFFLCPIQS